MSEWYLAEIRAFPYSRGVPIGWLECAGQILQIQQNQALYALLGKQYGGNGQTTFALPDLRGRVPVGSGLMPDPNRVAPFNTQLAVGNSGGSESVTLTVSQIPQHSHQITANATNVPSPVMAGSIPSTSVKPSNAPTTAPAAPYLYAAPTDPRQPLAAGVIGATGTGAAHENRQPFLAIRYCIAIKGIYPPHA